MAVLDDTTKIEAYRILTLRQMLKLEIKGIKRRGPSAYSILKGMGYTGTRQRILEQLDEYREHVLQLEIK
jgi:hypothetical protein